MSSPRIIVAALTALILAGAIGTSPAQAKPTALCSVNEDPCSVANIKSDYLYGRAESETSVPTHLNMVTSLGTVVCGAKLVTKPGEKQGEPLKGETILSFGSCTYKGSNCEVAASYFQSSTIEATGGGNGLLTVSEPWVEIKCLGNCKYTTPSMQASITGGKFAILQTETAMTKASGEFLCPSEMTYDGEFEDLLSPTYITHA